MMFAFRGGTMSKKIIDLTKTYEGTFDADKEKELNTVGNRIVLERNRKKWTLDRMAEELRKYGVDITGKMVNRWENGISVPNSYQLFAISKALGLEDRLSLFCSKGPDAELNDEGRDRLNEYRELLISSGKYIPAKKETRIMEFKDYMVYYQATSAGPGQYQDDSSYEIVSFPVSEVPKGADYGVRVSGTSMEPVFHDGQIIWVKECSVLNPGEVGIFLYDGNSYVKVYTEEDPEDPEEFTDSYGNVHKQPVLVSYNATPENAPKYVKPGLGFRIVGKVLK